MAASHSRAWNLSSEVGLPHAFLEKRPYGSPIPSSPTLLFEAPALLHMTAGVGAVPLGALSLLYLFELTSWKN